MSASGASSTATIYLVRPAPGPAGTGRSGQPNSRSRDRGAGPTNLFEITSIHPPRSRTQPSSRPCSRVEVHSDQLVIGLANEKVHWFQTDAEPQGAEGAMAQVAINTTPRDSSCPQPSHRKTPAQSVPRTALLLVASIARGRRWLDELIDRSEHEYRKHCGRGSAAAFARST